MATIAKQAHQSNTLTGLRLRKPTTICVTRVIIARAPILLVLKSALWAHTCLGTVVRLPPLVSHAQRDTTVTLLVPSSPRSAPMVSSAHWAQDHPLIRPSLWTALLAVSVQSGIVPLRSAPQLLTTRTSSQLVWHFYASGEPTRQPLSSRIARNARQAQCALIRVSVLKEPALTATIAC